MACSPSAVVAVATVCSIGALVLIALGFSTNQWQEVEVQTSNVQAEANSKTGYRALTYYDRNTGLFRICFPDAPAALDGIADKPDAICIKQEAELPERDLDDNPTDKYWMRIHLLRAVIAFLIVCLLMLLIGLIMGGVGCWRMNVVLARCAGVLVLLAAFFGVGGMALWHGAEYLEWEKVTDSGLARVLDFPKSFTQTLSDNTTKGYGWSYIIMWIGVSLCLLAGILYAVAASTLAAKQRGNAVDEYGSRRAMEPSPYQKGHYNSASLSRTENAPVVYAYDANYIKRQPFAYPNRAESTAYSINGDNSWGWNNRTY